MHDSTLGRIFFILFAIVALRYLWVRLRVLFPQRLRLVSSLGFVSLLFFAFAYRIFDFGPTLAGRLTFAIGGFWMVWLSNWLVACLLQDFILFFRLMQNHFIDRESLKRQRDAHTFIFVVFTTVITAGFWIYGVPHQLDFKVNHQTLSLDRPLASSTRIAVLSDIHFDPLFPVSKWARLLEEVQKAKPDVILIVGDLSDLSSQDLDAMQFGRLISHLKAPRGVFAVTGNHEAYMNQRDRGLIEYFQNKGIHWLMDESVCVEGLCVSGRIDANYANLVYPTGIRKSLGEFAPTWNDLSSRAWIVLDHQPKGLDSTDVLNLVPDLGVSGHTHAGQFFPWTFIIRYIWPLANGNGVLNGIPWITSSGFGQWGPALRVGSDTELLVIDIPLGHGFGRASDGYKPR
jgi:predicted MPP superfamily phosphohydrolase